jgi:hypothetical protein
MGRYDEYPSVFQTFNEILLNFIALRATLVSACSFRAPWGAIAKVVNGAQF